MKTAVRRVLLMSALMSPAALYALGLGDIRLNSALNQPFDAEIELISATQDDLGALRASLASGDIFARYGLDRPAYLSEFSFRVTQSADGKDVLRVTSPRPVTEPFVTLLVEASWPRGRLLREYTVLLDPPVYTPGPVTTETVATPRVSGTGATSVRAAEPAPAASSEAARASRTVVEPTAPSLAPGSTYQVRRNDTLWEIASSVNPGSRSNVNRAMVAIYQNNPQAFDGNINLLRSGSTLRIPDAGQIQATSAAEAAAEVARQYDAWRGAAAAPAAAPEEGRLRLVTPEQGSAAPSTAVAPAAGATAPATAAKAPSAGAADADLEGRIAQLEAELTEAKRLLEVRNAELATLQGGAAVTDGATPPADGAAAPADGVAAPEATPAEPAPAAAAQPEEPKPAAPVEPAGPTLLERVMEYWWALLALVAAALGFVLFQRLRRERGDAEEHLEEALGARDMRNAPAYAPAPRARDTAIVVEEKRDAAAAAAVTAAAAAAAASKTRTAEPVRSAAPEAEGAGAETGDPLAEADFHMAYGLYDQAADLVQLAIKREPQRRDLKLKLLEIYFVWGNRDRFMEQARELNATRSSAPAGEWDKILIMGKQIASDDPMFAGVTSGADSLDMELHGSATSLDMDLAGGPSVPDVDLGKEPSRADSSGIDFYLDAPAEEAVPPTVETPQLRDDNSPTVETPRAAESGGDTQELTVNDLGLDLDSLHALDALDAEAGKGGEGAAGDTVETAAVPAGGKSMLDDDADLLSSTSLLKMTDSTAVLPVGEAEAGVVDLSEVTGEMPLLEDDLTVKSPAAKRDYDLGGEAATMSEVGTKLDLARAYMDMGDPEGARSILEEVLQEGNAAQKQEAQRLVDSLP